MAGLRGQWLACSREARLVLLIAAVQLVLALPLLAAVAGVEKGPLAPPGIPWWVLLVLFAGAEMSVFVLRMRRERHTVSLSEIPLVLGLFFASPAALLVSRVGSVLALAAVRKQTLLKVAFNAIVVVGEVAVALVVFHTVPGSSTGSLTFHGWVAMYAAVVAAAVFVAVSITTVVSVYEGAPTRRDFVSVILSGPAMSVLVATVGLTGVHALDANVWSAAPLLVSVGLLLAGYRVYARLSDRTSPWTGSISSATSSRARPRPTRCCGTSSTRPPSCCAPRAPRCSSPPRGSCGSACRSALPACSSGSRSRSRRATGSGAR